MPKKPNLAPIANPGEDSRSKTESGEKLEITDTMSLVVSSGGEQYVVRESGVEKTPSSSMSPIAGQKQASYASSNASGGGRVVATASPTLSTASSTASSPSTLPTSMLGRIKFDQLELLDIIGHGSQGRVRRVRSLTDNEILALKSIAFSSDIEPLRKALVHELERTTAIKHPNVVSSFEAYFRNGKMYVLMEFMDCGTLTDVTKKVLAKISPGIGLTDMHVAYIAKEVLQGMAFVHEQLIMHRDMKPANMLCNSKGRVKISDFGVAGDAHIQVHHTTVGSTPYMSPERIKSLPYTQASDIWSIGISIAEIAIGEYPFGQKVKGKVFELAEIITGAKPEPLWKELAPNKQFSPELKDFVSQCLTPDGATRPTAKQLLEHPFIKKYAGVIKEADMGTLFGATKQIKLAAPVTPAGVSTKNQPASEEGIL